MDNFSFQATIIDYTLSRIDCNGTVLFNDLTKDPEMFQGVGDYQFEIYRIMRADVNNDWNQYSPITNIRWLHYLLGKILQKGKFRNSKAKVLKNLLNSLKIFMIYYKILKVQMILNNIGFTFRI